MVRRLGESDVIQCEEPETNALHPRENQAVLILLDHCRATRRQECLSRIAMAFLLIASLAVFFFFRMPHQAADRPLIPEHGFAQYLQQRSKARAHLTANGLECNRTPKSPTLAWEMRLGLADTQGLLYDQEKKALIVQSTGFYEVYLQITFRKPSSLPCVHYIHLNAIVYLTDDHDKSIVMTVYDSLPCKEIKSISTSGVYRLEANSELRVNVSDVNLVDRCSETKTYFGAFLVE